MKMRIGLTQRVEVVSAYRERRDCLDQNWFPMLESQDLFAVPLPNGLNDPTQYLEESNLDGFILTGGNDLCGLPGASSPAPERDLFERLVLKFAEDRGLPVLGVCRGMQMINTYFGGQIDKVSGHIATRHLVNSVPGESLPVNHMAISSREVNSYHAWGLRESGLGESLCPLGIAEDDSVEAICHQHLPWLGIMWHPEREAPGNTEDLSLINRLFEG